MAKLCEFTHRPDCRGPFGGETWPKVACFSLVEIVFICYSVFFVFCWGVGLPTGGGEGDAALRFSGFSSGGLPEWVALVI